MTLPLTGRPSGQVHDLVIGKSQSISIICVWSPTFLHCPLRHSLLTKNLVAFSVRSYLFSDKQLNIFRQVSKSKSSTVLLVTRESETLYHCNFGHELRVRSGPSLLGTLTAHVSWCNIMTWSHGQGRQDHRDDDIGDVVAVGAAERVRGI